MNHSKRNKQIHSARSSAPYDYRNRVYLGSALAIVGAGSTGIGLPYEKCHGKPKAGVTTDLKRPNPPVIAKEVKPLPPRL